MMWHLVLALLVMYLFGAWIYMLWEMDPILTTICGVVAILLSVFEDIGK